MATTNGGHTDFLVEQEGALLVTPGDSDALARAVTSLFSDQALRKRMGENNKAIALEYSIPNVVKKFEGVLLRASSRSVL